jgi:hypothetical protein
MFNYPPRAMKISLTSGDPLCASIPAMGRVLWSVRVGEFNAPEIVGGYRSTNPVHEPKLGDVLHLPDGSGPWRVIDWAVADRANAPGNVLVVESVGDQAA